MLLRQDTGWLIPQHVMEMKEQWALQSETAESQGKKYFLLLLWSSFFVTLVAKKYRLATMLPFVPRMVCDSR